MNNQSLLELHRLRAANLMSMMLLLDLGVRLRADVDHFRDATKMVVHVMPPVPEHAGTTDGLALPAQDGAA